MLHQFRRFNRFELYRFKSKLSSWRFDNIELPLLRLRLRLRRYRYVFIWVAIIALFINQEI